MSWSMSGSGKGTRTASKTGKAYTPPKSTTPFKSEGSGTGMSKPNQNASNDSRKKAPMKSLKAKIQEKIKAWGAKK